MEVYENIDAKKLFFYISDDQYFFANATPKDMKKYYSVVYPDFDSGRFTSMMKQFDLDENRKINTFSKGMKKQLSVICEFARIQNIFCDETLMVRSRYEAGSKVYLQKCPNV